MATDLTLAMPSERIASALEKLKRDGVALEALAEKIGCSHATLSQWQNGHTDIQNVKVGLLTRFCEATGVSLRWILTGLGPRIDVYTDSEVVADLSRRLKMLEEREPGTFAVVARMIDAASPLDNQPEVDGSRAGRH